MSQHGTPSETPGHKPAATQDHHDYIALLRQAYSNLHFLLECAPTHNRGASAGIPADNLSEASKRAKESEMWAGTGVYGEAERPQPEANVIHAAAKLSPEAARRGAAMMGENA